MSAPVPNLQLSEILQNLVDCGELGEGSDDYRLAQKVVREGFEALSIEEQVAFRDRVEPRLAGGGGPAADRPPEDPQAHPGARPFPPADLVSKRAG